MTTQPGDLMVPLSIMSNGGDIRKPIRIVCDASRGCESSWGIAHPATHLDHECNGIVLNEAITHALSHKPEPFAPGDPRLCLVCECWDGHAPDCATLQAQGEVIAFWAPLPCGCPAGPVAESGRHSDGCNESARTCAFPGDQEHDHAACQDVVLDEIDQQLSGDPWRDGYGAHAVDAPRVGE